MRSAMTLVASKGLGTRAGKSLPRVFPSVSLWRLDSPEEHQCHLTAVRNLSTEAGSWLDEKKASKERRRERFAQSQERKERLKTRRVGKGRGEKRRAFRSWFIEKKVNEEYMDRKARQANLQWKLRVAVILERIQVVMPDQPEWDAAFEDLQLHLSQFEKEYPRQINLGKPSPAEEDENWPTRNDDLLDYLINVKGFTPAPRETEADASGDVRTTDRKLKTSIYLFVNDQGNWQFPEVALKEGETFLDAAKRAIPATVGTEVEYWCPSNCPCAVDMMAFPEDERKEYYGTKTFFMKLQFDEGDTKPTNAIDDFAWLDRTEISDHIKEQKGDDRFYHYLL